MAWYMWIIWPIVITALMGGFFGMLVMLDRWKNGIPPKALKRFYKGL